MGWGDVLGLPHKLTAKADAVRVFFNDVWTIPTVVKADATDPATATTGDVRGTVDTNSASDGSAVVVDASRIYLHAGRLAGVAQYGG